MLRQAPASMPWRKVIVPLERHVMAWSAIALPAVLLDADQCHQARRSHQANTPPVVLSRYARAQEWKNSNSRHV
jgi:hypothetical protein